MEYFKTRWLPISLLFDTQSHKACGTIDCCLSNLVLLILRISHRTAHNTFWRTLPNFLLQLSSKSSAQQISALNHIDFHHFLIISFRLGKRKNLAGTSLLSRSGSKFLRLIVKFFCQSLIIAAIGATVALQLRDLRDCLRNLWCPPSCSCDLGGHC